MNINMIIHSKAINRHGILLLKIDDLIDIVSICKSEGIRISAIDAFNIENDKIQPLMEDSLDFSGKILNWIIVDDYLNRMKSQKYLFEIVV